MTSTRTRSEPGLEHRAQHQVDYSPDTSPLDQVMHSLDQRHPNLGETYSKALREAKASDAPWLNAKEIEIHATQEHGSNTYTLDPNSMTKAMMEAVQDTFHHGSEDARQAGQQLAHRIAEPLQHEAQHLPNATDPWHPSATIAREIQQTTGQLARHIAEGDQEGAARALNDLAWINQDIHTAFQQTGRRTGPETDAVHQAVDHTLAVLDGSAEPNDASHDPRNLYQAMNHYLSQWSPNHATEASQSMAHAISAPITYRVLMQTQANNFAETFNNPNLDNPEELRNILEAGTKVLQHRTLSASDQLAYHAAHGTEDAFVNAYHRLTETPELARDLTEGRTHWPDADDFDWELGLDREARRCSELAALNTARAERMAEQFMAQMQAVAPGLSPHMTHEDFKAAAQHPQAPEIFQQVAFEMPQADQDLLVDHLAIKTINTDVIADASFPQHKQRLWETLSDR